MNVKRPWLRYFNEPEGGAGGAAGGSGASAGGGSGDPAGDHDKGGTDEQLGEGGKKALETERTERKAAQQENTTLRTEIDDLKRQLQERDDAKLTDEERRQRDADQHLTENGQLKEQNGTLTQENLRLRAALEEQLPAAWADRVRGATPEEMAADAKSIKASLKSEHDDDHTAGVGAGGSPVIETSPGMGTLRHAYGQSARTK